ncbi:hypothetical protein LB524_18410 [Mesorhizobium sp. ESP6-5]|uniref:hypothetical protein n=1 Tax=Mesorhizobium sp. ESP6-5 TaxID=2876623 RepID=UPI001CCABEE5|nr:hypothetical protein [Mesorhizobium sp. ESP6-5]MBZ9757264.1 hypothetical protein [Mesorhizobium sp. ESP6-5]
MSGLRLAVLIVATSSICTLPAFAAAESSYVYCDNGLRCFKAPCPSNSALDLATGTITKGVSIDTSGLPQADEAITAQSDVLYSGKIVVRGSIEHRIQTFTGKEYSLPWLVATRIVRTAKDGERKHCSSH